MKKNIKKYLVLFLTSFLLVSFFTLFNMQDILADDNVELIGQSSGLVLVPEGGKLFDIGRLNPGDTIRKTLKISNSYSKPFTLYMRAERIGEEPKDDEPDLLKQLKLTITYKGEVIYKGPASGKDGESGNITSNISLGKFDPQDSRDLIAEIELPGPETGNEFQNKTAEIKWIFTAQTSGGDSGGGGKDKDKDKDKDKKPPVEIEEEPIPEGKPEPPVMQPPAVQQPEIPPVEVPVEEVPQGIPLMPKTGEELPYIYYTVGIVAIITGLSLSIKKKS
ncbi:LPXTG cell wall anchor domain-containing protein [Tepidanaerobacter sp. EBM-38]|uniref:LPXTG cell wall anchor domain-containing protein n=1 Tax=Tepidanaerobacter sp. EBM-38 TaxID=1918496 RepID=UPI000AF8E07A|nr:LPXTG cell wall anchor domain-containing protein [Tepidanaerobacter sp. EBM-38]